MELHDNLLTAFCSGLVSGEFLHGLADFVSCHRLAQYVHFNLLNKGVLGEWVVTVRLRSFGRHRLLKGLRLQRHNGNL